MRDWETEREREKETTEKAKEYQRESHEVLQQQKSSISVSELSLFDSSWECC